MTAVAGDEVRLSASETVMMPARDGIRLYTELFFPAGTAGPYPTVLMRTPYPDPVYPFSKYPVAEFTAAGYAVAVQSCRGTWRSEGVFRFFQNEPDDGYDCVEWLAGQAWSSGRIGMSGSSYLGSTQWLAARRRPPHLACIAPQSPGGMFFYETPYFGGALNKHHLLTWPHLVAARRREDIAFRGDAPPGPDDPLTRLLAHSPNLDAVDQCLPPAMAAAMKETLLHPTYDEWWEAIMLTEADAARIDIPVFAITGFHDGDQAGALYNWALVEQHEASARSRRRLLVGPWRHAQMGDGRAARMGEVEFGPDASVEMTAEIIGFFDTHLKGHQAPAGQPPAGSRRDDRCRLFVSGTNRWLSFPAYPPPPVRDANLYLSGETAANSVFGAGRLSFEAPGAQPPDQLPAWWTVPVPVADVGADCRESLARHDVLVYTSAPLAADLTVLGPVRAEIHLSADAPDADVVVRIEDVHPDGRSVNMTGELGFAAFRARYRQGFEREVPLVPGEPDVLPFHVCHMGHAFLAGHRIRVSVAATAYPAIEPNHHTGEPVATAAERRTAVEAIYHDQLRPSHLILPVLPAP